MKVAVLTRPEHQASTETSTGVPLETLARNLQAGREGALEALIARTEKACYRLARSQLKDPELSRDAVQDAYFVVYQRIGQLREPAAFKGWLFRIVVHCCHDISRKRNREFEKDLEPGEEAVGITPAQDPANQVARQTQIRDTFEKLPEIDRQALALREVCSLSYEEMSQVLKVPLGTVRSRLAKARKRFIATYRGEKA